MGQADRTFSILSHLAPDESGVIHLLAPGRVALILGPELARRPQSQLLLSFAVNLLARLFPVVQDLRIILPENVPLVADVPRWTARTLSDHLQRFLEALAPPLCWTFERELTEDVSSALVVGDVRPPCEQTVYVGSDGWEASVSPAAAVPVGVGVNPVGAYTAACLGTSEVWKRLLRTHGDLFPGTPPIPSDTPITFSSFTYVTSQGQPNPALPSPLDLGRLTIVGLGAGGGAAAYTLSSIRTLKGTITQVEPDEITAPNLNRYVMADAEDAARRRSKTEVVEALFHRRDHIVIRSFAAPHDNVAATLTPEDHRFVLASVHSREARRSLQYETPMVLWDAGATEQGDFFVWRHTLGTTNCMWCKHPPGEEDPEQQKAQQLATIAGLDEESWLRKVRTNDVFTAEEVSVISAHATSSDASFDVPLPGQRYGDWEVAQCGRLRLPEIDAEIPVPFAPVMAGILLAGEVIKEQAFHGAVLDSYYWNTLVGRFMLRNRPYRRAPSPGCRFCSDPAYLAQYERRWT